MGRLKGSKNKKHVIKPILICPICAKTFERWPNWVKRNIALGRLTYCSRKCSDANRKNVWKVFGKDHHAFKTGETAYRALALKHKGYVCEQCSYNGSEFPSVLWVHHKNFERRHQGRDNSLNNLEVLCIRCHMEKHLANDKVIHGGFHAFCKQKTENMDVYK